MLLTIRIKHWFAISRHVPDTQLRIIFLPLITFSARLGIRMMMVADCSGMVLRWRYLYYDYKDHFGIFKAFKGK